MNQHAYVSGSPPGHLFLREWCLPNGSMICFDKGYLVYSLFAHWPEPGQQIGYFSRLNCFRYVELRTFLRNSLRALLQYKDPCDQSLSLFTGLGSGSG